MPRSAILTGLKDQRDRAKQRGRLDHRRSKTFVDPVDKIHSWLEKNISIEETAEAERLNLTNFLRKSAFISLPAEERLRQLAMHLKSELYWHEMRGWLALDRIYQEAISINPHDVWIHHSRSITEAGNFLCFFG